MSDATEAPEGFRVFTPRTREGLRFHLYVSAADVQQFNDHRVAVKYEGERRRWLPMTTHEGLQIEVRPAACNLPRCFCDAEIREAPLGVAGVFDA